MRLVDEIIAMTTDSKRSLPDALRKCLVLAFDLNNDKLKEWVEKELNGFGQNDDVPEYRRALLHSKGNFTGPMGHWLPGRPLPTGLIDKQHQYMLTSKLVQPIAVYEGSTEKKGQPVVNWPPDLIAHYQSKFIHGYVLSQAWQEVPKSLMVGLCEEVRNRLLRFALEIRREQKSPPRRLTQRSSTSSTVGRLSLREPHPTSPMRIFLSEISRRCQMR